MINYKVNDQKLLLNCTPVYENIIDRSSESTEGLKNFILDNYSKLKSKYGSMVKLRNHPQGFGGIKKGLSSYTEKNLFEYDNPYIKELEDVIYAEVQKYYDWLTELSHGSMSFDIGIEAFYQVMEKGDHHMMHNHSALTNTTFISGCFYVDGGDAGKEFGGVFRPILNPYIIQEGDENAVDITPTENKIIMLPSNVYHEVSPYFGEKKRIVIAFNVYKER